MAVDGASLLAAAIRVACQVAAPRRTVQAVASAVTAILVRPAAAVPRRESGSPAGAPGEAAGEADDAPALLASLRAVRQAQRARKKERRRAAKVAAATAPSQIRRMQLAVARALGKLRVWRPLRHPQLPQALLHLLGLQGSRCLLPQMRNQVGKGLWPVVVIRMTYSS